MTELRSRANEQAGQLRALARLGHAVSAIGSDLAALLRRPPAGEAASASGELLPFAQGTLRAFG